MARGRDRSAAARRSRTRRSRRGEQRSWLGHLERGLSASTRHNALAYGYSLALSGTFGMIDAVVGRPRPVQIILFGAGAAFTHTVANLSVTRGYRRAVGEEPALVRVVGTSFSFLSISGALAAVWLLGTQLRGDGAWFAGGFVGSAVYLVLSALEVMLARLSRPLLPDEELAQDEDEDEEPE